MTRTIISTNTSARDAGLVDQRHLGEEPALHEWFLFCHMFWMRGSSAKARAMSFPMKDLDVRLDVSDSMSGVRTFRGRRLRYAIVICLAFSSKVLASGVESSDLM